MKENEYYVLFLGTLGMTLLSIGIIVFFIIFQRKQMKLRLSIHKMEIEHSIQLLKASIDAQEKERKRFSEDLHDDIGVILSTAKLCLNRAVKENREDLLKEALKLVSDAMKGVRSISHALLPPNLVQFGLWAALEDLCNALRLSDQLMIDLLSPAGDKHPDLKADQALTLYRVIKELLNNTIKHSQANKVIIEFHISEDKLALQYSDNGIGFSSNNEKETTGLGIKNIESRILALNGNVKFAWEKNTGMNAFINIPLNI